MAPVKELNTSATVKRPKYREMVKAAIADLAERKGSSRQAIMKYIIGNYSVVDDNRTKARVRTALVEGVKQGEFAQTKGTGASGSFKLGKPATVSKTKEKAKNSKETKNSPKKASDKDVKTKPAQKRKATNDGKDSKKPKINEAGTKAAKKKPPNPLVAKAAKNKSAKASGSVESPNAKDRAASPLTAVKKIKAKLLFTSTPSKKKNKVSKLLTPKRVVVKTKKIIKKPKAQA